MNRDILPGPRQSFNVKLRSTSSVQGTKWTELTMFRRRERQNGEGAFVCACHPAADPHVELRDSL